jgi:hypothetical protein
VLLTSPIHQIPSDVAEEKHPIVVGLKDQIPNSLVKGTRECEWREQGTQPAYEYRRFQLGSESEFKYR